MKVTKRKQKSRVLLLDAALEARSHNSGDGIAEDCMRHRQNNITIADEETAEVMTICDPQQQSPLFYKLPREIRDEIWAYATAPYEDSADPYPHNKYYYRPGHTARSKTDTTLLLTCRRIWLEANRLPMLQAEHCFWYHRPAPDARNKEWMAMLTSANRRNFGVIHMFVQMFAIEPLQSREGSLKSFFLPRELQTATNFQPRMLHVTVRHTDWWLWESEEPLRFRDSWLQALLDTPDLRSTEYLKLELETLDYKVPQLLPIVERLERLSSKEYDTHVIDGRATPSKFVLQSQRRESKWSGPTDIDGEHFDQYRGKDKLNYHIITLTWKLHFPQYPKAHLPTIRLSPRLCEDKTTHFTPRELRKIERQTTRAANQRKHVSTSSKPHVIPSWLQRIALSEPQEQIDVKDTGETKAERKAAKVAAKTLLKVIS